MHSFSGLFTSESVTEGHPDKVADRISDAVLDACLAQNPLARVACETLVTKDQVVLAGEISGVSDLDYDTIVRSAVRRIGYNRPDLGFSAESLSLAVYIRSQSADIALGVDQGGAGDQGMVFGYACNENEDFMPTPIHIARMLSGQLARLRQSGFRRWLRPDGKTQVTIRYEDGVPVAIDAIVISAQHDEDVGIDDLRHMIKEDLVRDYTLGKLLKMDTRIFINPTGRFVLGGPAADAGVTGRKIIVDTYGGMAPHGGGAFSGKDPSKQDRSAAYMARHVAISLVDSHLADRVLVQLAYVIGEKEPVSVFVQDFGTGKRPAREMEQLVRTSFDLTPEGIIRTLDLRKPIYENVCIHGHLNGCNSWGRPRKLA